MKMKKVTTKRIKDYWEMHPFHSYESPYKIGTKKFFEYADYIKKTDTEKYSIHLWRFNEFKGKKCST